MKVIFTYNHDNSIRSYENCHSYRNYIMIIIWVQHGDTLEKCSHM